MHTYLPKQDLPAPSPTGRDRFHRRHQMTAQPNDANTRRNAGDEMLTLQEACAYLRIPEGTLRYWRHLGSGPHSFKIGRHVRYWRTDLILWLTEQTNRAQEGR
jgi:excisionase family DNA binding protein